MVKCSKSSLYFVYPSLKAPVCQRVSLCVWMFPNSSETGGEPQRAEILRDDSPWDWEGFRLKNSWIRGTVSRKINKK